MAAMKKLNDHAEPTKVERLDLKNKIIKYRNILSFHTFKQLMYLERYSLKNLEMGQLTFGFGMED